MKDFMDLDRNIRLRIGTAFLSVLLSSTIMPNMAIYYSRYFGAATTGLLLMVAAGVGLLAGLFGGHLSDAHGRKPIMLWGDGLMVIGLGIAAAANSPLGTNPWLTFAGFLLARIGGNLEDPAAQAMMIDVSTSENRRFIYALLYWIMNISVMLGAAIGGWFFRDWLFELMLAMALVAVFTWLVVRFAMSETFTPTGATTSALWDMVKSYTQVLADRRFMVFFAGSLAVEIIFNQPMSYLPVHLDRDFHTVTGFGVAIYGQRMLSVLTLVNTVLIVACMAFVTRATKRWSTSRGFAIGTALLGGATAVSFLLNSLWPLVINAVVQTIGEMISVPPSQTLRADLMDPEKVGAYSGVWTTVGPLASMGAGLGVTLSTWIGNGGMAAFMGVLVLTSVVLVHKAATWRAAAA
ncbi:MDR family MFS transporter [Lacticaseibacillus kribbianus]|uniref:MDR family MFS transporter n=1 Tax=Lacticaseibacillus kribbianus TaxID=2926292 RepID=UPI001CD340CA|nr:MFS transporter [Lacticaseibacillus kribbianus]